MNPEYFIKSLSDVHSGRWSPAPKPAEIIPAGLKPFDLDKALAGAEVVTRGGAKVTEVVHMKTITRSDYTVRAVIDGDSQAFTTSGRASSNTSRSDLFLKAKERTVYANVYKNARDMHGRIGYIYEAEDDARAYAFTDNVIEIAKPITVFE